MCIRDSGKWQLSTDYLKHRLARIYPIYWLVALLLLPMGVIFGHWPGNINVIKDFLLWPRSNLPFVPVAWTLIHEMLFYVSFLLFFISSGLAWTYFLLWSFLIALVSGLAWNINTPFCELYLHLRNIEFVLGMLVAAYLRQGGRVPWWCLSVGGLLFLSAGVNASIINKGISTLIPQYHLLYGASSVLLVAGFATCTSSGGRLVKGFAFLGRASYSIYLIHFAVLSAVIKLLVKTEMNTTVNFSILIASGVIIGTLLYQYAERPLLKFSRQKMNIVSKG